ncbi:alternative ribosome rescue aminoacyl-tRNA hydrolase ArfB [uncultured Pseudokineococcus sp.]|uniref:alternative ribosome rescue aminoacyl-tRNA hydrolase ArfB n=1 Tax=uncultured Pseudokineococcus sp. TaxID=1642928 RepID=UPI002603ED58|nr:alternative ribosome rescue aminoacyl-tRNA hydrolase ArfB [uncultured Pseudokineococcus sp.]
MPEPTAPALAGGSGGDPAGDLRVTRGVVLPSAELGWRFSRAGGPGGQGVNTTDSAVELRWSPERSRALSAPQRERVLERLGSRLVDGALVVRASEHREQRRNRSSARERLRALVAEGLRPPPPPRREKTPSRRARARRTDAKTARGRTKALRRRPDDG